jgi:hypothetical protein
MWLFFVANLTLYWTNPRLSIDPQASACSISAIAYFFVDANAALIFTPHP